MLETFIAGFVVMIVSLVGVVTSWKAFGGWITKNLHYLISFAAGVFFLVALDMTLEVAGMVARLEALAFVVGGIILFLIFGQLVPESHHHHDPGDECDEHTTKAGAQRILMADALHNVADGIILVPAYVFSLELGIAVTIGIVIHEAVQEISEFFVLREAGYTIKEALIRNFLVSATILVGIVIGLLLTQIAGFEPALLGVAAGGFFYVVFIDLLPKSFKVCKTRFCMVSHLFWALIGVLIMMAVNFVTRPYHVHVGGDHDHGHDHGHVEDHEDHAGHDDDHDDHSEHADHEEDHDGHDHE